MFETRQFLAKLVKDAPDLLDATMDSGKIYPAVLAARMIGSWPQHLEAEGIEFLDKLCRKINVAKTLSEYYEPDWKKSAGAVSMSTQSWPVILAVLLSYPVRGDDHYKGRTLKYLNAVYTAFAILVGAEDIPYIYRFKDWAEYKLAKIIEE